MKKFFSVLLSILFALCLLFTLILGVVRFNFSYSTITNIASKALKPVSKALPQNKGGLFYPGSAKVSLATLTFDGSMENFEFNFSADSLKDLDVNALVQSFLDQAGIDASPEFVAEVLASPEAAAFVDKYGEEVIGYVTGAKNKLDVDPKDVKKLLNKSIDLYEKHGGEKVDRSGMDHAVDQAIKTAVPQITASLDEIKEESSEAVVALKALAAWLELKLFIFCVAVCAVLALIIFLINKSVFAMFKHISIPAIVGGASLFAAAALCGALLPYVPAESANIPKGVFQAILDYSALLFFNMKICAGVTVICGIVLCAVGFKMDKKKTIA